MTLYSALCAVAISFLLLSCVAPKTNQSSYLQSQTGQESLFDRAPAQEKELSPLNTSREMIRVARAIQQQMADVGNIRHHFLTHFAQATGRILSSGNPDFAKITSLYRTLKRVAFSKNVSFMIGKEDANTLKGYVRMNQLADSLQEKVNLLRRPAIQGTETEKDQKSVGAMNSDDVGSSISFMRFISNRVVDSLIYLTRNQPSSQSSNEEKKHFSELVTVRNSYIRAKGNIDILSTIESDPMQVVARFQNLKVTESWKSLLELVTKIYIAVPDSNDVNGTAVDMKYITMLKLGPKAIDDLAAKFGRGPASVSLDDSISGYGPTVANFELEAVSKLEKLQILKSNRTPAQAAGAPVHTILVGNIPGQYITGGNKNTYFFGYVQIQGRVIVAIERLAKNGIAGLKTKFTNANVVVLQNSANKNKISVAGSADFDPQFDVIYPGLINLHNHTKQNNLPVWGLAQGQFENRFEWRDWDSYTKSVSQNMNPWIQFGKPIECAAFRWSEIQAMVVGTTYLQGPSTCVDNFGIQRVEDAGSFVSTRAAVQAPTDIVVPGDFVFVWQTLRPLIKAGKTYEQALAQVVGDYCPDLKSQVSAENVNEPAGLAILKDQALLLKNCPETKEKPLPPKFVRYIYWVHPGIAGKKKYISSARKSAVIAHLAEGNRTDSYNRREYEVIQLLGLNKPFMNFVHGVGIDREYLREMAKNQMGLVWSPFSNLILYGQTLDIKAAHEAGGPNGPGVIIALGSDWLPTGTKGPLEEVKVAAQYIDKDKNSEGLRAIFTDEYLFQMITENPAKMINHWEISPSEAGVGRIAVGAMGSLIAVTLSDANPFTNIVRKATERDINLVVIDGRPIYGNIDYLGKCPNSSCETISEIDGIVEGNVAYSVAAPPAEESAEASLKHLVTVAKYATTNAKIQPGTSCRFEVAKGFVFQPTTDADVKKLKEDSGLNLDRFADIQKLLAVSAMSQSLNKISAEGNPNFSTPYFPSLYSCNDGRHTNRIAKQVMASEKEKDNWTQNLENRDAARTNGKLGSGPKKLGELYK